WTENRVRQSSRRAAPIRAACSAAARQINKSVLIQQVIEWRPFPPSGKQLKVCAQACSTDERRVADFGGIGDPRDDMRTTPTSPFLQKFAIHVSLTRFSHVGISLALIIPRPP